METNPPHSSEGTTPQGGPDDSAEMLRQIIRLNAQILGVTFGLLAAIGLFLATNILILKGGPNVGAHLGLLGQYFPGYRVTFLGSFIGAIYGGIVGYVAGWIIGTIYNWVVVLRSR
jgi:hypothetical protein